VRTAYASFDFDVLAVFETLRRVPVAEAQADAGAGVAVEFQRKLCSRSGERTEGSTTQPSRIRVSRELASISGGEPGRCQASAKIAMKKRASPMDMGRGRLAEGIAARIGKRTDGPGRFMGGEREQLPSENAACDCEERKDQRVAPSGYGRSRYGH